MKKFVKERSKVMLAIAIISVILFVLCLQEILNYSSFIHEAFTGLVDLNINSKEIGNITGSILTNQIVEFNSILVLVLIVVAIFNIAGYVYKKEELVFISIGLLVVSFCMLIYVADIMGIITLLLLLILNILGYIDQRCLNIKKSIRK